MKKICKYCGKEFSKNGRQLYCCPGCKIKANNDKKKKTEMKTCAFCGKDFMPTRQRRNYCSMLCCTKAEAERKKAKYIPVEQRKSHKVYPPKPCAECGEMFIPGSGSARYCSPECHAAVKSRRTKKGAIDTILRQNGRMISAPTGDIESPATRRFYKMSLREVSAECARLHISYGQASLMAQNGTLPEEFGKG